MDFLKEIVKELGDDFTQLESAIEGSERFIDTGSHNLHQILMKLKDMWTQVRTFLMGLYQAVYLAVYLTTRLLLLLVRAALERLIFPLLLSKTFWILTLMGIASILILKQQSIKDYWSLVELIRHGWLL